MWVAAFTVIAFMRKPLLTLPSKRTTGYSFNILNSVTGEPAVRGYSVPPRTGFPVGANLAEPYPITVQVGILRRGA